ncbi:tapasin-related protein-like isoform X2 [Bufo gargarizans]|uniref:tapasin-related protein-like isoform X2 n=1 Tax=Bufo gargarizans TaxID=30331 RepID=UPI001CF2FDD9|nr:tapasin-related protein-like isoform X2 [Bufo gargarizans]
MESNCPISLILCVLFIGGNCSIEETTVLKLPCLYGSPQHNLLDNQPLTPNTAWVVLAGGQDRKVENLDFEGIVFILKDSPVNLTPFLKWGLEDIKCDLTPYFTADTQILWPGVTNTDNGVDSWYIYTVKHNGGKFSAATFFTKLSETPEKKEDDKHHVLATFMLSTRTPRVYARLMDSALLDCAFTVDHRANVSVTWNYRGRGSQEGKIIFYNGSTKKLQYNWKGVSMQVEELENGYASLLLRNVALKTEGLFICTVSVASLFAEQQIHLQIRERPNVKLNVDSVVTLKEGDERKFLCDASNYYPLDVNMEWLRELPSTGLLPSLMLNVIYSSHRKNHNGTYSLSGSFLYKASLQDNGVTFTCRVEHESLKKPIRNSVTLIVLPNDDSPVWMLALVVFLVLLLLYCVRIYCRGCVPVTMTPRMLRCNDAREIQTRGSHIKEQWKHS